MQYNLKKKLLRSFVFVGVICSTVVDVVARKRYVYTRRKNGASIPSIAKSIARRAIRRRKFRGVKAYLQIRYETVSRKVTLFLIYLAFDAVLFLGWRLAKRGKFGREIEDYSLVFLLASGFGLLLLISPLIRILEPLPMFTHIFLTDKGIYLVYRNSSKGTVLVPYKYIEALCEEPYGDQILPDYSRYHIVLKNGLSPRKVSFSLFEVGSSKVSFSDFMYAFDIEMKRQNSISRRKRRRSRFSLSNSKSVYLPRGINEKVASVIRQSERQFNKVIGFYVYRIKYCQYKLLLRWMYIISFIFGLTGLGLALRELPNFIKFLSPNGNKSLFYSPSSLCGFIVLEFSAFGLWAWEPKLRKQVTNEYTGAYVGTDKGVLLIDPIFSGNNLYYKDRGQLIPYTQMESLSYLPMDEDSTDENARIIEIYLKSGETLVMEDFLLGETTDYAMSMNFYHFYESIKRQILKKHRKRRYYN